MKSIKKIAVMSGIISLISCPAKAPQTPTIDYASQNLSSARTLFDAWVSSQNTGDFSIYSSLYGEGFEGTKRVGSQTMILDRSGWLADREKMFQKPFF